MDIKKKNEAAWDYHADNYFADDPHRDDIIASFKAGADWLMQQPLSERLTDEEKEKIKGYAKGCSNGYTSMEGIKQMLFDIFGAELFKDK